MWTISKSNQTCTSMECTEESKSQQPSSEEERYQTLSLFFPQIHRIWFAYRKVSGEKGQTERRETGARRFEGLFYCQGYRVDDLILQVEYSIYHSHTGSRHS